MLSSVRRRGADVADGLIAAIREREALLIWTTAST
jgi:hypothetical protein